MNILYTEHLNLTSNFYDSFILPDNIVYWTDTLPESISITRTAGIVTPAIIASGYTTAGYGQYSRQIDLLRVTRINRDRQAILKKVKFWSWTTFGSFGVNSALVALALFINEPEIGALSIISHAWFGISNIFLGNAYFNLNRSLNTYGPAGKNPYIGMGAAYGAFIFACIGVGIGITMFDGGPTIPGILGTISCVGLSNLLGVSAFVYYLLYDKP